MGFSRQEYWSGLPFPSPRDLPNPGAPPNVPKSGPIPGQAPRDSAVLGVCVRVCVCVPVCVCLCVCGRILAPPLWGAPLGAVEGGGGAILHQRGASAKHPAALIFYD